MRAIILHWTSGLDLPVGQYLQLLRTREVAFGFAAALWLALIFVVVHGGTLP